MTFAEYCEWVLDAPLTTDQKRTCDAMEERYRKDGNQFAIKLAIDLYLKAPGMCESCQLIINRGGPKSTICSQLIELFSLYLKCEEEE